ncbi:MAG: cobalamin-dependent protein, partial [Candidatus Omnitrophota bacterium]
MKDVILIHCPIILYNDEAEKKRYRGHGGDERSVYPMGILYIAACLERAGHSVRVIDVSPEGHTIQDLLKIIEEERPGIVGLSAMTTSISSAVSLASAIKGKFRDDVLVGLGGVHLRCDPGFMDRFPIFDFGVTGEAEKTFGDIVRRVKAGEKVRGIIAGELIKDLDALPFPARHLINPAIYLREEQMKFEIPAAGILGSRGCPYGCGFCCIPAIGKSVRLRSPENVVDEMESVYDQCRGSYHFLD